MSRPEFKLEAWHFTSTSALVREIEALLQATDYKLIIVEVTQGQKNELDSELDGRNLMGRVKVEMIP